MERNEWMNEERNESGELIHRYNTNGPSPLA